MGQRCSKSKKPTSSAQKCKPQKKSWTQDEWKIHGRYLTQLAKPKKDHRQQKIAQTARSQKVPLSALKPRMNTLAQPRTTHLQHTCKLPPNKCHCHVADPIRNVQPQAKNYVPTPRIKMLSQPKLDYQEMVRCFPRKNVVCLNRKVLQPSSSYRIKKLAVPKYQYLCAPDSNPYGVKPEALNAVATERTVQLAQPKSYSWIG
ncbi:uncharacterized protein LOC128741064 [Sabethes cyaneus]|uniref:uncharacterized protein LOC128741064 n=1 Tax=Sabethes cyaneus TaxID=53552 RepID=UPI00237E3FB7|nr:uncharacterized protein LOC128741064 [Sabethes cyaneus]